MRESERMEVESTVDRALAELETIYALPDASEPDLDDEVMEDRDPATVCETRVGVATVKRRWFRARRGVRVTGHCLDRAEWAATVLCEGCGRTGVDRVCTTHLLAALPPRLERHCARCGMAEIVHVIGYVRIKRGS